MSEVVPLTRLWSAMAPRRPAEISPPDVGAIAAAAEAQGRAAGRAQAETDLEPLRTIFSASIAALDAARAIDPAELRPLFIDLVERIARAVIDGELRQSAEPIGRLVDAALAAVTVERPAVVRLSIGDAARIAADPRFVADPDLADGEVRVEAGEHVIAASLAARLTSLVEGLA